MPHLTPLAFDLFRSIGAGFDAMMQPLYSAVSAVLVGFHWLVSRFLDPNSGLTWVLSIMLLTFLIRTLMIPLFMRSIKSSRNMQLIQPKMQELQKKYGHDRELLGQETMKLYKEEGVNPMSSCLPLLIQMPIFWALFTVLNGAARGHAQGSFLKSRPHLVESLRNADVFGARLADGFMPFTHVGPTQVLAIILIASMTAVLFITQLQMTRKNMPPEALTGPFAQQQKMMLYIFPIIYAVGGVAIPIGVLIYWLTTNCWTLVQQWILIRNSPAPNTPAYLDWEERMRKKGLDPRQIERERQDKRRASRTIATAVSAADSEAPRVQRQSVATHGRRQVRRPAGSAVAKPAATTADEPTTVVSDEPGSTIVRQQPRRQTRAVRRKK